LLSGLPDESTNLRLPPEFCEEADAGVKVTLPQPRSMTSELDPLDDDEGSKAITDTGDMIFTAGSSR
jgi:hypothetical protein